MSPTSSHIPNDSPLSRILKRSSALLETRRISLFRQRNSSAFTVSTINTILPQYTEGLPQSEDSTYHDASQDSLTNNPLPSYLENENNVKQSIEPFILRPPFYGSSTSVIPSKGSEVYTHSVPLQQTSRPWVTLHVYSPKNRSGVSHHQTSQPQVCGGSLVEGLVELDIEKPTTIQEIKLTIKGRVIMGSSVAGTHTFLSQSMPLWSKSASFVDPYPNANRVQLMEAVNGKLSGYHTLPFSFLFPTEVNRSSLPLKLSAASDTVTPFPFTGHLTPSESAPSSSQHSSHNQRPQRFGTLLPPSFAERDTPTVIRYELHLQLSHGRLRSETRVTTGLTFLPTVTPPTLPLSRRLAYETAKLVTPRLNCGVLIPGPLEDPSSWFALEATTLNGVVVDVQKPINAGCVLYISQPLSYTSGTVIPCFLSISSDDSRVLDTLSTPTSPQVRLVRKVGYPTQENTGDNHIAGGPGLPGITNTYSITVPSGDSRQTSTINQLATAVWWKPPKDVEQQSFSRYLAGEIHLSRKLLPTSSCDFFTIEYFVELLPFCAQSCVFDNVPGKALATQIVEIASRHAIEGPVPVPFTQPPHPQSLVRVKSSEHA